MNKRRGFRWVLAAAVGMVVVAAGGAAISVLRASPLGPPLWSVRLHAMFQKPYVFDHRDGLLGVRYGMKREDVWKVLGKPYIRPGIPIPRADEYPYRGFSVTYSQEGAVAAFLCGSGSGDDGAVLARSFRGRTPEGIGMGSSKEETLRAYGTPSSDRMDKSGSGELVYRPRRGDGRSFTFRNGRLVHLAFFFLESQGDARK